MKNFVVLYLSTVFFVAFFAACSRGGGAAPVPPPPPPGNSSFVPAFLANTQWVGTYHQTNPGTQYDHPCCLQFRTDDTVMLYSNFIFLNKDRNGFLYRDSLTGKIEKMDTYDPGSSNFKIQIRYAETGDIQNINVYQQKTLQSATADVNQTNALLYANMELFPARESPVSGTTWKAKQGYVVADLSTIEFRSTTQKGTAANVTVYGRNGKYAHYLNADEIVEVLYVQKGARVYMSGYNEESNRIVGYIGILLPSGNEMLASSSSDYARYPTSGPAGAGSCPRIVKQ